MADDSPASGEEKKQRGHSSLENKVRLSLLQSEKRFVDLELGLAELKEAVDKFRDLDTSVVSQLSELPDLRQRIESLEDLVMVENAGIEELKNVMEGVRDRLQGEVAPQAAESQPAEPPEDLKDRMAILDEVQEKLSVVGELKQHMDEMSHEIAAMKEQLSAGPTTSAQTGNIQLFSTKLDNMKAVLDELIKRKVEIDLKIEKLDKTVSFMQARRSDSMPEGLKKEIDSLNRIFSVVDSRIDAIESVLKNFTEELQRVRMSAQKFDSFEKASNLIKELQGKMEEFKFIENEIKRVSNRVEGFYENIDQRLDRIREFERLFPQMKQNLDQLRDELMKKLDESRVSVLDRATKDETSEIRDRLSQVESKVSDTHLEDIERSMDKLREEVRKGVAESREPLSVVNIEISDLMSRLIALETRLGNLERLMQNAGRMQPIVLE